MAVNFIIGRKIGMTRIFDDLGFDFPVTIIEAGPCEITQIKSVNKEGYSSVQIGFIEKSIISLKISEDNFMILDNIVLGFPKTSEFVGILKNLKLDGKKVTVLIDKMDDNLYLGSRNIKNICVVPAQSASAYDLLDCQMILADEASVKILNDQLSN